MTDTVTPSALTPANLAGNLRNRLYQQIAPCLPGRVYAYAPASPFAAPPALWIAGHSAPSARPLFVVTFTVIGVGDGAAHSAQAMIDELCSAMVGACATGPFTLDGWSTSTMDVDIDVSIPSVLFDVSATLSAFSFCPPIPYEAAVPPEVITP